MKKKLLSIAIIASLSVGITTQIAEAKTKKKRATYSEMDVPILDFAIGGGSVYAVVVKGGEIRKYNVSGIDAKVDQDRHPKYCLELKRKKGSWDGWKAKEIEECN